MAQPDVNLRSGMINSMAGLVAKMFENQYAKVYHVDNVNGSVNNTGASWVKPLAEISEAVTAWETYRATLDNVYERGLILVRGTGTAYTALTALPNYCDMVGIGADPRGNGTGIASITAATGVDTCDTTGVRGLGLYNLQFTGSGTGYALDAAIMFRSVIENCAFVNKSTGGLRIVKGGGITIRNCMIGGGDTVSSGKGLENSGTDNFNNCLVENNVIMGTTHGVIVNAYLANSTVFRNNTIYGGTIGVDDNSTETNIVGNAWYVNNFISGTDAMELTNNAAARAIGNYVVNGTTGAVETTHV